MPDGGHIGTPDPGAKIGPNAILQLAGPVETVLGPGVMPQILRLAGCAMPSGKNMISQSDVVRVHDSLRCLYPGDASQIFQKAGAGTARYIKAHRIPNAAQLILRLLPAFIAERLLTRAILAHAWTFCGSGTLTAHRDGLKTVFVLKDNPLAGAGACRGHQCVWHAAVFAELFSILLRGRYRCVETICCGTCARACRFEVWRHA